MKNHKGMKLAVAAIMTMTFALPSILPAEDYELRPRVPDYSRPYGSAGSPSNPYIIRDRYDGNIEIRTKHYDYNRDTFAPGQPLNPYIVQPVR